jgi:hypothetical protein
VGGNEGKRTLGRPRRRRENNIKVYLQEVVWGGMNWIAVARNRQVAGICECGNEISGSINAGNFMNKWEHVSFSRRTLLHGIS